MSSRRGKVWFFNWFFNRSLYGAHIEHTPCYHYEHTPPYHSETVPSNYSASGTHFTSSLELTTYRVVPIGVGAVRMSCFSASDERVR